MEVAPRFYGMSGTSRFEWEHSIAALRAIRSPLDLEGGPFASEPLGSSDGGEPEAPIFRSTTGGSGWLAERMATLGAITT